MSSLPEICILWVLSSCQWEGQHLYIATDAECVSVVVVWFNNERRQSEDDEYQTADEMYCNTACDSGQWLPVFMVVIRSANYCSYIANEWVEFNVPYQWRNYKSIFAGHVLRGSSGENALLLLEGKMDAQVAQGRPRHVWIDDIKMWTNLDTYEVIKCITQDRQIWRTYFTSCRPSTPEDGRIWWRFGKDFCNINVLIETRR